MKKFIALVVFLLITNSSYATLTVNNVPKTKTGSSTPTVQDSDITDISGNVGIGSTTPGKTLDVQGTVRATGINLPNATNNYVLTTDSSGNGTWRVNSGTSQWTTINTNDVYLTSNGNVGIGTSDTTHAGLLVSNGLVGIGTTNPIAANNQYYVNAFENANALRIIAIVNNNTGISAAAGIEATTADTDGFFRNYPTNTNNSTGIGGRTVIENENGGGVTIANYLGTADIRFGSSYTSPQAIISSNGNLGISSTTPGQRLDVQGSLRALFLYGDGSNLTGIGGSISGLTTGAIVKAASSTTIANSVMTEASGNIGINSTTPGQMLDVRGTVRAVVFSGAGTSLTGTAASLTAGNVTTNANLTGPITSSGNATSIAAQTGTGTTFAMQAAPNFTANVGIGSASPGKELDVQGTVRALSHVQSGTFANTFTGTTTFSASSPSALFSAGNVGVFTVTPGKELDVQGTVRALFFSGNGAALTGVGGSSDYLATLANTEVAITTTATATISKQHLISGTSANYTVTLPAASGNTGKFLSFRIDPTATKLFTIDGNASETIDGALTRVMWAGESAILYCDGSNWFKIAGKSRPMICQMRLSASQSGIGATPTRVDIDATDIDNTGLMADTTNHQIVIKRTALYQLIGRTRWSALASSTGNGARAEGEIYLTSTSGTQVAVSELAMAQSASGAAYMVNVSTALYSATTGDALVLAGDQSSGTNSSFYGAADGSGSTVVIQEIPSW